MPQFNFKNKIISLVNSVFKTNIEVSEETDDVTAFDAIKTGIENHMTGIETQLSELQTKADGYDDLKKQVDELTAEAETNKKLVSEHNTSIEKLTKDFEKKLTDLKDEVRTELSKEKQEGSAPPLSTVKDVDTKVGGQQTVQMTVDEWKGKAPNVSVGQ